MDVQIALQNLKDIRDILEKHKVGWWIDGGTCLGAYRDKGFISHDTDTDIGVLEETYDNSITDEILATGFTLREIFGSRDKGYELAFVRNNIKTDIFFYYKKGRKRWYAMYHLGKMIPMVYPARIFSKQRLISFYGEKFKVPGDVVGYLTTKYGDFMTRIAKEDWVWHGGVEGKVSPKNIDMTFIT